MECQYRIEHKDGTLEDLFYADDANDDKIARVRLQEKGSGRRLLKVIAEIPHIMRVPGKIG